MNNAKGEILYQRKQNIWASSVPVNGIKHIILLELAKVADEYGRGRLSIPNLVKNTKLPFEQIIKALSDLFLKKIIIHLYDTKEMENQKDYCKFKYFQLRLNILPEQFGEISNG